MRKLKKLPKLGRKRDARLSLFRSLAKELLKNKSIRTSEARAKAVRPFLARLKRSAQDDKMTTVTACRRIAAILGVDKAQSLYYFNLLGDMNGIRIIKLGERLGDRSVRVKLELIREEKPLSKEEKK